MALGSYDCRMKDQMLYRELAKYYDLVYDWKQYEAEVKKVTNFIKKFKKSEGNRLLEAACGTGHHLQYLKDEFECMGIDLNTGILREARKRHPDIVFKRADMMMMDLKKKFDVITCLFSSIGYVKTLPNLQKTLKIFARHLKPGGVAIIEGWLEPDVYKAGSPGMKTYSSPDLVLARVDCGVRRGMISIMDMHFLIAEKNKPVRHYVDHHELGLFTKKEFVECMKKVGLEATVIEGGLMKNRNLYIGMKPQSP